MICARKFNKISEFSHGFCPKMPEFYVIIAQKIFFPKFGGHVIPLPSPSPAPMYNDEINNGYKAELDSNASSAGRLRRDNVTLTFELLTPKPNQLISVPRCTNIKRLAQIHQ